MDPKISKVCCWVLVLKHGTEEYDSITDAEYQKYFDRKRYEIVKLRTYVSTHRYFDDPPEPCLFYDLTVVRR
jgi:hypothetical protein